MDMQRIQQRMTGPHQYDSVEDIVADFVQMFDNACKYNEPDSLIYKVSSPRVAQCCNGPTDGWVVENLDISELLDVFFFLYRYFYLT